MAKARSGARVQPWPSTHVCNDGKTRNLATFTADEWRDHPDVQRGDGGHRPGSDGAAGHTFYRERIRAARSLGRDPVAMVARMSGRKPLPRSPLF